MPEPQPAVDLWSPIPYAGLNLIDHRKDCAMNATLNQVEQDIHDTLQSGQDIYTRVYNITLKALTEHDLDLENIKSVVEAVASGIASGLGDQYQPAQQAFQQSAEAIDHALEKTAQASKLAFEEASENFRAFTQNDFRQAGEQLKNLEGVFLQALQKTAQSGNDALFKVAGDFIAHARQNGTAVGQEARAAFEALNNLRLKSQQAARIGAAAATSTLASIAGGILSGIADSLKPERSK